MFVYVRAFVAVCGSGSVGVCGWERQQGRAGCDSMQREDEREEEED